MIFYYCIIIGWLVDNNLKSLFCLGRHRLTLDFTLEVSINDSLFTCTFYSKWAKKRKEREQAFATITGTILSGTWIWEAGAPEA